MKVSVVIPAFNEEKYIEKCLISVLNQKTPADEIIVVDNNSTDNTVDIVKKYQVTLLHETKQGMTPTRNKGYDQVKYEIIARTDADSEVPSDWIERIKEHFQTNNCDALVGSLFYKGILSSINAPFYLSYLEISKKILGVYPLAGPNMAITKKIWVKIKPLTCLSDKEVHEDIDLSLHIHQIGGTVCFDKNIIVRTSMRRLVGNPRSFFLEYPRRLMHMKQTHQG